MRATFYEQQRFREVTRLGTVELRDGVAVIPQSLEFLHHMTVRSADGQPVAATSGAAYLRALPTMFKPPYLWADLEDDGLDAPAAQVGPDQDSSATR